MVEGTPLPPAAEAELRRRARVRATHYSTRIEGNKLTLAEAEQAIEGRLAAFHGRERDVGEVRRYWQALLRVEEWAAAGRTVDEELIRRIHAMVEKGGRADADLTKWLEYFIATLARVFAEAKEESLRFAGRGAMVEPEEIRRLDARARIGRSRFSILGDLIHPGEDLRQRQDQPG